MFEIAFDVQ